MVTKTKVQNLYPIYFKTLATTRQSTAALRTTTAVRTCYGAVSTAVGSVVARRHRCPRLVRGAAVSSERPARAAVHPRQPPRPPARPVREPATPRANPHCSRAVLCFVSSDLCHLSPEPRDTCGFLLRLIFKGYTEVVVCGVV